MAESEEELKSVLMKVKVESEKVGLKLNIQIGVLASSEGFLKTGFHLQQGFFFPIGKKQPPPFFLVWKCIYIMYK